jgi:hypothetical protein
MKNSVILFPPDAHASGEPNRTGLIVTISISALLLANVIQGAKIFDGIWPKASSAAFLITLAVTGTFLVVAAYRQHLRYILWALAFTIYLIVSHIIFLNNSGGSANFNSIAYYMVIPTFVAFFECDMKMLKILKIFAYICFGYTVLYISFNSTILSRSSLGGGVLASHDAQGGRVYLASAYAAFVGWYAIKGSKLNALLRIAMVVAAFYALWLSGTRLFTAVFCLLVIMSLLDMVGSVARSAFFAVILTSIVVLLLGLFWPGWNPFDYLSSDNSGYYRAREYSAALDVIKSHWLMGVGVAGNFEALQSFLHTPRYEPLFASDLGGLGPLFEFGLLGLLAFIATAYFCLITEPRKTKHPELSALYFTCITCSLYGVMSPMILVEPASIFVALLIAVRLRRTVEQSGHHGLHNMGQLPAFGRASQISRRKPLASVEVPIDLSSTGLPALR